MSTAKGRKKFISLLPHLNALDARFARRLDPKKQAVEAIEDELRRRRTPAFRYVISEDPRVDRREMLLQDALEMVVGSSMGTILSCIPGRLAYFEGEEPGVRYVCERPAALQ